MRTILFVLGLSLLLAGTALARESRRGVALGAKPAVEALYKEKGWVAPQRISAIAPSRSGKSWHLAVVSGKHDVRLVTVRNQGRAFIGFTGLATQKEALAAARSQVQAYQPNLRVDATFTRAGLSTTGASYRFKGTSAVDSFDAYVTIKGRGLRKHGVLNNVSVN